MPKRVEVKKVTVAITVDPDLLEDIREFAVQNRMSVSAAVRYMLTIGLRTLDSGHPMLGAGYRDAQ